MWLPSLLIATAAAVSASDATARLGASEDLYAFDDSWQPAWPMASGQLSGVDVAHADDKTLVYVTQRENPGAPQVLILDAATGEQIANFEGLDWLAAGGAHGINVEESPDEIAPADAWPHLRVWVEDFTNHTLAVFSGKRRRRDLSHVCAGAAANSCRRR